MRAAYDAAARRFTGLLDELCERIAAAARSRPIPCAARCKASSRAACMPRWRRLPSDHFITPMAAVAGSVAEEILGAMTAAAQLDRAYVNNGGDIALHLADGEAFHGRPGGPAGPPGPDANHDRSTPTIPSRGIATSGRHGRSFSLGIADAVTVLARTASQADAAATIIANAVDLPGHPAIVRCPAHDLQPDSDLGARLVTRDVGELSGSEIAEALEAGAACARRLLAAGIDRGRGIALAWRDRSWSAQGSDRPDRSAGSRRCDRELMHA